MYYKVGLDNNLYPRTLKEIKNPPKYLYFSKLLSDINFDKCIAVVGSRNMTSYGKEVTQRLIHFLVSKNYIIVSGLMYGIDSIAHKETIKTGGITIGVLPCGLNQKSFGISEALCKEVNYHGSLISEYEPDFKSTKWSFAKRNRIIVGISALTIVIEAELESGSLIAASYTQKYNKDLIVMPGNITSKASLGCLKLIKSGVNFLSSIEEIGDYLKDFEKNNKNIKKLSLNI